MAGRIRSIKPEILEDEKTAALSHLEWRLFVSLFLIADDYGNLRGEPAYVRGQVLWATSETTEAVGHALGTLSGLSLLSRYTVRGQSYYHISGWDKHQKVEKPGKPRMPGPEQSDSVQSQHVAPNSRESREDFLESRESLSPDLRSPISDLRPGESLARAIPPIAAPSTEYDCDSAADRGKLARDTYARVSAARMLVGQELKLPDPLPFPPVTPSTITAGFRDLADRIREEGSNAPLVCNVVIESLIENARKTRSIEWLAQKAFGSKAWNHARDRAPEWRKRDGPKTTLIQADSDEADLAGCISIAEVK